ncbi:hypothetical protein [Roseibium sediminicola]|uniref:Uncharacterized protein n=1 Tax=Roseibium sediminicola TaxID=2933272 RepID=A0ABT0H063_9HYPH|nr:hypothetical protein [Roseibium sp. CAU 1639]MCK7615084.1 hypothetical protein [Roseibium sp. CAU 1639]
MWILAASVLGALAGCLIAPLPASADEPPYVSGRIYEEVETTFNCIEFSDARIIASLMEADVEVDVFATAANASTCYEVSGMVHVPEQELTTELETLHVLKTYQFNEGRKSPKPHYLISERNVVSPAN